MKDVAIGRQRTPRVTFSMRLCDYRLMKAACKRLELHQVDWLRRLVDFGRRNGCEEAKE